MNTAMKPSLKSYSIAFMSLRSALFHSTPVLDRRRKTNWNCGPGFSSPKRFNNYAKRVRNVEAKHVLLRNVSAYAEHLFQSWKSGEDEPDHSSSRGASWFKKQYSAKGTKTNSYDAQESNWDSYRRKRKGGFEFCCSDGENVETIFESAFRGARFYHWSFTSGENLHWETSWKEYSYFRNSRFGTEDRYDRNSTDYSSSLHSGSTSDRIALGLSTSGPLKLEQIKSAYRVCALKWHPDRHQGSTKEVAEEKFKLCSAAYKSLCEKLSV